MNNDIIKMFIGGEEVVSNKEFAINEEMLSASSTILNNCYPASWETNKDYASNFYYPKDYSKFILGKGNFTYGTDQYYILTVSGNTFMQFTTNIEKELAGFNVYGKSTQATRSGKNLLNISSNNITNGGIDIAIENSNHLTINGKATQNYPVNKNVMPLILSEPIPAGTYTFSVNGTYNGTVEKSVTYEIKDENDNMLTYKNIGPAKNNTSFTFTVSVPIAKILFYRNMLTDSTIDFDLYLQLEKGTTATEYEPYGVMPSPDYPSEIESVGYENLFDKNSSETQIGYFTSDGTLKSGGGSTVTTTYTKIVPNIDMTISGIKLEWLCFYDKNKNFIERIAGVRNLTSNTFNKNASYIRFQASTSVFDLDKIQLEKGTIAHSYIPYGKYGIEVKNTGKNLFNKDNLIQGAININTGIDVNSNYSVRSNFIKVLSNTNYILSFGFNSSIGYNAKILQYDESKNFVGYSIVNKNTKLSILTSSNVYYIRVSFYTDNIITPTSYLEYYSNIQLEKGSTSTAYEPYQENTSLFALEQPLRSLPNGVKDIAYIKNNILYVDRKVGTVVLNGSDDENWTLNGSNQGYGIVINDVGGNSNSSIISGGYCNCLSETIQNNIYSGRKDNVFATLGGTFHKIYVRYNSSITSIALLKEQLNSQPIIVQYELAEPYTENLGTIDLPIAYNGVNNVYFYTGLETDEDINYYWKNYDVLFAGIVKNSGDISLRPTDPKYCSLQILDYKTFLSESDTLDFVISEKTIAEAISMVVDAISGYGFILGTINISQADDVIGAYSTLNKTAYDVFQYLANISGSRWRARFVDSDTMAIDFYDPELLPRANDIDYTQQYWEDNKIVDLTFNYGTRDYRNKQIILSDEVYGGIDYTEVLLSNGYGTSYITQNNIANITSITVNGVKSEVITQSEKDLGVDADFYYTPGKNVVESTTSYSAGTQIIITYTPLVKGRQIVYNDEEVTRIATQTNTTGVISRYENRNDILSSDELENIAETYIKYKGKPEIILKLTTLNNDLFSIGEICYFNSPIADLAQDYMVKSKATNYTSVAGETNIFYTYELTSSFNSEKAINYFDNQRNKTTGNIAEGESITRNIDINNSAMIIWENATITEISVSVDGDNALNSVLNSPFIQ